MKILFLHASSDLYGSSKILYLVAKKFCADGHEVHLIVSEDGPLIKEFNKIGCKTSIIRLGVLRKKYMNITGMFNRILVIIAAFIQLRKLIQLEKIDLIYTNTTPVIIGGILSTFTGIPTIWHLHEIMDPPGSTLHKIFSYIIKSSSSKVVAVSVAVYNNWLPYIGANKLTKIYNGIPIENVDSIQSTIREELKIDQDTLLIGMIGRLNLHKGQFYFLEIASQLIQSNSALRFIIVGDAFSGYEYLYDVLKAKILELKLDQHVFYLGYRTDISQIMKGLDIFVLPSIKPDPFPTVVLEAMSHRIPVVATAQGGAMEQVLDGQTGVLIPIDDAMLAAEKMQHLLADADYRLQCGLNGQKRLEECYSLEVFEKNMIHQLNSIV